MYDRKQLRNIYVSVCRVVYLYNQNIFERISNSLVSIEKINKRNSRETDRTIHTSPPYEFLSSFANVRAKQQDYFSFMNNALKRKSLAICLECAKNRFYFRAGMEFFFVENFLSKKFYRVQGTANEYTIYLCKHYIEMYFRVFIYQIFYIKRFLLILLQKSIDSFEGGIVYGFWPLVR